MWSLRAGKTIVFGMMCGLLAAAAAVSSLIAERQDTLKDVSRYNICWLSSQAVAEFTRLEAKVAAAILPGGAVDVDEVQLRYDILSNRLSVMSNGEFADFAERDPEHTGVVRQLGAVLDQLQPMIADVKKPGVGQAILDLMAPLDAKLSELAASANEYGSERVTDDQRELVRLFWLFRASWPGSSASAPFC